MGMGESSAGGVGEANSLQGGGYWGMMGMGEVAMKKIFRIIPALDTRDLGAAVELARAVGGHPMVYGFKVGFGLGLTHGLGEVVRRLRDVTGKRLIYDHQKAATDIPGVGELFADTMKGCGVDEVILFPQAGPRTLEAWVGAIGGRGLKVIVGGVMTHAGYLASEGGFIGEGAGLAIFRQAVALGVKAFVVPLTRPELVAKLAEEVPFGGEEEFYIPGYGAQGGEAGRFSRLRRQYLIVGRALLGARDPCGEVERIVGEAGGAGVGGGARRSASWRCS